MVNKEDGMKYSHGSNKYVDCKCPNCGFEKQVMVSNLCRKGFKCPICSDGISYKEKYIVIDGRNKDKDWMVNSILNSKLAELIDLDDVNWEKIDIKCHGSILIDICSYYDKHQPISTIEIANKFSISRNSVVRYLNIGYKYGFCSYNSKQARIEAGTKGNMISKKLLSRKVDVFKDGVFIKSYDSAKELYRRSILDYGIQFCYVSICAVCRGVTKKHHGYVFKYRKEYEK